MFIYIIKIDLLFCKILQNSMINHDTKRLPVDFSKNIEEYLKIVNGFQIK